MEDTTKYRLANILGQHLGVCIMDRSLAVLYQNEQSRIFCGDQRGQRCSAGCTTFLPLRDVAGAATGITKTGPIQVNAEVIECVLIDDGESVVSLQFPIELKHRGLLEELEDLSLTKTEKAIVVAKLQGWKNREIAAKYFISNETLRTHIKNIHHKLPEALWLKLIPPKVGR